MEILLPVLILNFLSSSACNCTDVPNFIWIGQSATELWPYVDFPRWWPYHRKSTSAFRCYDVSHLGKQRTICVSNVDLIYLNQRLRYYYFRKRSPYWNANCGFHINLFTAVGMWFYISLSNFVQIRWSPTDLWRHIDFPRWRP